MRGLSLSALLLMFALSVASAQRAVELEMSRMSPTSGFVLPRFGTIYMEISYRSEQPIRLQARGYSKGVSLDAGQAMNASLLHPAGSGRALVWISYSEPAVIDEIKVTAYDDRWQPLAILSLTRPAQWLAKTAEKSTDLPEWVAQLIAKEREAIEQYQRENPRESGLLDYAIGIFMFLSVPGYFVLQAIAFFLLAGRWRWAGLAPLVIMVPAICHALYALSAGSNIWPIVVIFTAPLSFLYLVVLLLLRGVRSRLSFA